MGLRHFKREAELIPFGWAVAYRDFNTERSVCYPIPLHLLVRWARDIRFWLMTVGRPGYREKIEVAATLRANTRAWAALDVQREHIRETAYAEGWDAHAAKVLADFENYIATKRAGQ